MLNNINNGISIHINFLKNRLAHFVAKYGARNIFDLNMKTKFDSKEEEIFVNGLHHKLDAFTTVSNIINTEPDRISTVPLDEGQILTSNEKFQIACNAYSRAIDNEITADSNIPADLAVDVWNLWDATPLPVIQQQLLEMVKAGNFKDTYNFMVYLWYQENVERTNYVPLPSPSPEQNETPVLV